MGYRLPAYLHRNRHGTLYFRLAVPDDIRHVLGQKEIYRSLNTSSVRQAADAAQTFRITLGAIFRELRSPPMPDDDKDSPAIDWSGFDITVAVAKEKARHWDKIEELQAELAAEISEGQRRRRQHERELDVAIKSKGGVLTIGVGKPFSDAMAEFLDAQRKATTRKTYRTRLEHAQAHFGAGKDIRHIEQADLSAYAAHAKTSIANSTTAGFHITTLCGMLNLFRTNEGWGAELVSKRLIEKKDTPDSEDRDAFTLDQLASVILSASKYRERQPYKYWATVATAFTGCRIEELAQINLHTDLRKNEVSGVWYLDLNAKPDPDGAVRKSMKNKASWRCIPIHSALVKHGFIDYLLEQKGNGFSRPFESGWKPLALEGGKAPKWSHYMSNWGGRALRKLIDAGEIEDPERKLSCFHSMRHTFSGCMGNANIPDDISEAALGHSYAGKEQERYRKLKSNPDQLSRDGIEPGLGKLAALLERM